MHLTLRCMHHDRWYGVIFSRPKIPKAFPHTYGVITPTACCGDSSLTCGNQRSNVEHDDAFFTLSHSTYEGFQVQLVRIPLHARSSKKPRV